MKQRVRFPLAGLCMIALLFAAGPAAAASSSCNCSNGNYICVIMDDDNNVTGWILQEGGC